MPSFIAKRIEWAVDLLQVEADDEILEVGCGNGAAVSLICRRLTRGHIIALDRSEKMVRIARERSRPEIESGKASIRNAELADSALDSAAFSKIFVFNLNVFWMDPVAELDEIRRLLAPTGAFFIFHNPPPASDMAEYANAIAANLVRNRFVPDEPVYDASVFSLCIRSRPA